MIDTAPMRRLRACRQQLQTMMHHRAADTAAQDAAIERQRQAQLAREDAELAARAAARSQLQAEVAASQRALMQRRLRDRCVGPACMRTRFHIRSACIASC